MTSCSPECRREKDMVGNAILDLVEQLETFREFMSRVTGPSSFEADALLQHEKPTVAALRRANAKLLSLRRAGAH